MLQHVMSFIASQRKDDRGASAVEYGLLVAAIAALIVIVVFALGDIVQDTFSNTCEEIADNDENVATVAADCGADAP